MFKGLKVKRLKDQEKEFGERSIVDVPMGRYLFCSLTAAREHPTWKSQ